MNTSYVSIEMFCDDSENYHWAMYINIVTRKSELINTSMLEILDNVYFEESKLKDLNPFINKAVQYSELLNIPFILNNNDYNDWKDLRND